MAPLIRDGIYRIRNGEYNRMVAAVLDGIHRPIVARTAYNIDRHDMWRITNVGAGGNEVTIENVYSPGTYADLEEPGDSLIGSRERTVWTIVKVDSGMYYLQSPDATRVWELSNGAEWEPILLVPHTGQKNTKWTFNRLGA